MEKAGFIHFIKLNNKRDEIFEDQVDVHQQEQEQEQEQEWSPDYIITITIIYHI